ncbi:MAG: hypothetical protein U0414_07130 [Polyangiaceae bacterium]
MRANSTRLSVFVVAALVSGCGSNPDKPTAISPDALSSSLVPAPRLTAPTRPKAIADVNIDYAGLPLIEKVPLAAGALGPSLGRSPDGMFHPNAPNNSITLLQVGAVAPIYIVGGNEKDPPYVTHPERIPQMCNGGGGPVRAAWMTFVSSEKMPDSLVITRFEGTFDAAACVAKPERSYKVQARAIVPSTVYAYRARGGPNTAVPPTAAPPTGQATQPASATPPETPVRGNPLDERLEIIGPRSIWVGTDAPTELQNQKLQEPFARLVVPVQRGSSASAVLDVASDDLKAFRGSVLPGMGDARVVAFSFEVVWAEGETGPSATAFVSALPGTPEQLGPPQQYSYETTGASSTIDFLE